MTRPAALAPSALRRRPVTTSGRVCARGRARARSLPGFTLLEIGIALVILGLMLAIAVPSINAISGAELKKTTGMLQGLMRDTYSRAALSGNTHRVVFDLEVGSYWIEATEGGVVMKREKLSLTREGGAVLDKVDERIEDIDDPDDEAEKERLKVYSHPSWTPVPFPGEDRVDEVTPQKLPSEVRFKKVWVDHMEEPAVAGQVALHFFPGGYTQEAHVTITDDELGENTFTLETNPLTGEIYVHREEPEIPEVER